jgi:hypothetical protein
LPKKCFILLFLLCLPQFLLADTNSTWKIQGFGTFGGAYQQNKEIGFRSDTRAKKSSRGDFSFATDTKLGLQLDVDLKNDFSVTIQGLTEQWDKDDAIARIEWANLKYNITNHSSFRVGRMRNSNFMYSDIQNVSYAYNWVRLPQEVYSTLPFRDYNGAELNYFRQFNDYTLTAKLFYGYGKDEVITSPYSAASEVTLDYFKGIVLNLSTENFKIRTSYSQSYITFENISIDAYFNQTLPPQMQQTYNDLRQKYQIDKKLIEFYSIGLNYDYADFSIIGEYIQLQNASMLPDTTAGYVSLAYQIDKFTPYLTIAQSDRESNYENDLYVSDPGVDPTLNISNELDAGFKEIVQKLSYAQKSKSIGIRCDFLDNATAKVQYDYIEVDEDHRTMHFRFDDSLKDIHLFSATIDFVF